MLAVRLVRLIENHIEQLSRDLSEKVWSSPRCSDLNKVPAAQLEARTREIYRNLSDWLLDKTEAQVERRYTELGAARAEQGVAYSHFVWAIISTKEHVRAFRPARRSVRERHGTARGAGASAPAQPVLRSRAVLRRRGLRARNATA